MLLYYLGESLELNDPGLELSLPVEGPAPLYYLVESLQLDGPGLELSLQVEGPALLLPAAEAADEEAGDAHQEDEDDEEQGANHEPEYQLINTSCRLH